LEVRGDIFEGRDEICVSSDTKPTNITIVGAGPVGCLLSIYLARRDYQVTVVEKRGDMRTATVDAGRSINLALSNRGIRAMREAGVDLMLKEMCIPMKGRMMHNVNGETSFLPYGREGQYINSVSRSALNIALINEAEASGVSFRFQCPVKKLADEPGALELESSEVITSPLIIGADGAVSAVRRSLVERNNISSSEELIEHGYKELTIPPGPMGFQIEKNALHIWPRESFMLIALPNPDGSFTCTLFLALNGVLSFEALKSFNEVNRFFETNFPDARKLLPDLEQQWSQNQVSVLGTIKCRPWSAERVLLIGDAAHAVVPFYGQGMNAGFEDCRILSNLMLRHQDNWDEIIPNFEDIRKPDADAIAKLALDNFIEMRDLVADPEFLLQKKIEAKLHELFPDKWIPLYSMVTFEDDLRYSEALTTGDKQRHIMKEVMKTPGLADRWQQLDFASIVNKLEE
jgi:kynurenine 3-monooxygenase